MIDINPEIIRFIIATAREFQTGREGLLQEIQASPLEEEEVFDIQGDVQFDSTTSVFNTVIEDLEPDQQQCIVALMWLGRGDFALDEWQDAVEEARVHWSDHTAAYLMSTPLLADYLSEGLSMHGYSQE